MFDHPIIDVTLGLVLFYVLMSLFASVVQEWISSLWSLRSKILHSSVQNLIGNDYAQKVYEHALIKNLEKKNKLPSYIAPETLSTVLLAIIARGRQRQVALGKCKGHSGLSPTESHIQRDNQGLRRRFVTAFESAGRLSNSYG